MCIPSIDKDTHGFDGQKERPYVLKDLEKYTKYSLRPFRRLAAFLPRQNCLHLTAMDFRVIFVF